MYEIISEYILKDIFNFALDDFINSDEMSGNRIFSNEANATDTEKNHKLPGSFI